MKGFLSKCAVLKVDLLQDRQIRYWQACMCALLSPKILQAGAVKGLRLHPLVPIATRGTCHRLLFAGVAVQLEIGRWSGTTAAP